MEFLAGWSVPVLAVGVLGALTLIFALFIGRWIDARFGTDPLFAIVFLMLGLVAGVRETIGILRKASTHD